MLDRYKVIKKTKPNSFYSIPIYAGLEHRAAFPSQSETAAGMRVTEVRKAGWHIEWRPKTKIYDAKANPITVTYDMLGRKTELTTKDGGAKRYTYDELHLLYEDDEVMRQSGSRIDYSYDGFNRVVKIAYPEGGDVEYEYGIPISERDAKANAAGKVISVRDEAGETRYEYGKLGEVTKETRTLKRHIPAYESEKTAVMEYVSDYLGRMQKIVYPDREVVTYGYDAGGQVCSITGERDGKPYTYVADIRYDEYGQRVYIKYGNGVETNYTYDENMRWLKHIGTENKYGTQYQNINYSFDDVGNVLGYKNDCMNGARYSTEQTYTYDALYQLIKAEGVTEDNPYAIPDSPDYRSNYEQNFSFDAIGNMTYKKSKETITPAKRKSGGDDLNYDLTYEYDTNYAHRLTRAGSEQKGWRYYTYDANGNVTSESDGVAPSEDTTTLTPVTVTTHTNEAGESVYEADYAWAWPWSDDDTGGGNKPSLRNRRIYEWNSRNLLMRSVALGYDTRYAYSADGNRAAKWTTGNLSATLYFNTMWTWHIEKGLSQEQQGQYSKHIYLGETRIVTKQTSDLEQNYGPSEELRHQYYYHPDHLGSAQLVTDFEGNEYQRIEYTPYGELWVEKKTANEKGMRYLPYKFTAKEQDEETGLYYYGARYLDAKYSTWISTDPALSDYLSKDYNGSSGGIFNPVNFNLYHYSGNNPVTYKDPDGNDFGSIVKAFGKGVWDAAVGDVKGIVNIVCHPVQTVENTYNYVKNEVTDFCSDPNAYVDKKINDVKQGITDFIESSPEEKAYAIGGVTEKVAVTAIATKGVKAIKNHVPRLKNGSTVYRVYGGDSSAGGASWTTKNPESVKNYRNKAGLPSGRQSGVTNTGQFIIQGTVEDASQCVLSRKALPLDGNKGGLNEYIIPNAVKNGAVNVTNVSGVNPEF